MGLFLTLIALFFGLGYLVALYRKEKRILNKLFFEASEPEIVHLINYLKDISFSIASVAILVLILYAITLESLFKF